MEGLQDDVNKFKTRFDPLLDDSRKLINILNSVFGKVDDNIDVLKDSVVKVRDTVDNIIEFEQRLQSKIESPVMDSINAYSALVKGIKVSSKG